MFFGRIAVSDNVYFALVTILTLPPYGDGVAQ